MYMCLARGGVGGEGGEWMRGLGLGFTNPVGTGLRFCLLLPGRKWSQCKHQFMTTLVQGSHSHGEKSCHGKSWKLKKINKVMETEENK